MSRVMIDSSKYGRLIPTERVELAAALCACGHRVAKHTMSPKGPRRLTFWFPPQNGEGEPVVDVIRRYKNHELQVDAKKLIDCWMELRDTVRNKELVAQVEPQEA